MCAHCQARVENALKAVAGVTAVTVDLEKGTAAVTGRVPLWFLFSLPMLYHIVVEDRQKVGWPVHDWLPEASALCCMEVLPYCSLAMRRRYPAEGGVRPPLWGPGRRPPASEPVLHLRCVALSDEDPEHRPKLYPGRSGDRPSRTGYHTEAGGGDGALRPAARAAGGLCANGPVPGTGRSR